MLRDYDPDIDTNLEKYYKVSVSNKIITGVVLLWTAIIETKLEQEETCVKTKLDLEEGILEPLDLDAISKDASSIKIEPPKKNNYEVQIDEEVSSWLEENCKGDIIASAEHALYFEDEGEAWHFKLVWC